MKGGFICKVATLQKFRGAKCKKDLTVMISSSSYPKNIYGMPLDEIGVQIKFEFEFKFKFELKQKKKTKEKEKKTGLDPLPGPSVQSSLGQRSENKKKRKMGRAHWTGPRPLPS